MGHSQGEIDALITAIGDPMPKGDTPKLTPRLDALELWRSKLPLNVYGERPTTVSLTKVSTAHPPISGTVRVYVAGLRKLNSDFTVVGNLVTFGVALLTGALVVVDYDYLPGT